MLKKFLFACALACMLSSCGESDSLQAPKVPPLGETGSSSSSEVMVSPIPVMDTLPFDTTGIKPQVLIYRIVPDGVPAETRAQNPEMWGQRISVTEDVEYCTSQTYESGKIAVTYKRGYPYDFDYFLLEQGDSLMFANVLSCDEYPLWGTCRGNSTYSKKIMVGNEAFFYVKHKWATAQWNEWEAELIQLKDSTITIWKKKNPSYVEMILDTVAAKPTRGWKKSEFEGDSLVTFVGELNEYRRIDTIFIEKYNLKITDEGSTWIFENETCSSYGYKKDTTKTMQEQCKDEEDFRNGFVDCTAKNMKTPEGVYPRLCRPFKIEHSSVWCILDGDYVPPENR
jgi:hypothetical protein